MTTTGPGAATARPRGRRWLLAAAPWVAAAALAAGGLAARGDAAPPVVAAPTPPAAVPTPTPTPAPGGAVETMVAATADLPAALELAVLASARATLGTAGLHGTGPAAQRWPLEVLVAEVEPLGDGLALAHVLGLVIDHVDGAWRPPTPQAVAVPIRLTPPAAVLGAAWPLSPPVLPAEAPHGHPIDDPDPSLLDALVTAGWQVTDVEHAELVLDRYLRLTVLGTAPGDHDQARHTVWLRDDPGGPRPLPSTAQQQEHP